MIIIDNYEPRVDRILHELFINKNENNFLDFTTLTFNKSIQIKLNLSKSHL